MAIRSQAQYEKFRRGAGRLGSLSSYGSTMSRRIQSAEDDYYDDQYEQGNLTAEKYLDVLQTRAVRFGMTPLQQQNVQQKIRDVYADYKDSQIQAAYNTGGSFDGQNVDTSFMVKWEQDKLDKMTPDSEAYNKQFQKVEGLKDKANKESKREYRIQTNKEISEMPEDTSERIWAKYNMYEQLEAQARADGDNSEADIYATQKNNYAASAKKADINDYLTQARLEISGQETAGLGVPTAEGGQEVLSGMGAGQSVSGGATGVSGGGTSLSGFSGGTGVSSSAVNSYLKSLDRQGQTLERLYQSQAQKQTLIQYYQNAVAQATGDQKTTLTIALNNLVDDLAVTNNSIANAEQGINDTVIKLQEAQQKAYIASVNQEVRKNNAQFDKAESKIEDEFRKGKIGKEEYLSLALGLADTKYDFFGQVSDIYSQSGEDDKAEAYIQKATDFENIREGLKNVANNYDDYEPVVVQPGGTVTNIFGKRQKPGDVVLKNVRLQKDSGNFESFFVQKNGIYHPIQSKLLKYDSEGMPLPEYQQEDIAQGLGASYIYISEKGKLVKKPIDFVKYPTEDGGQKVKPFTEDQIKFMRDKGAITEDKKGNLVVPQYEVGKEGSPIWKTLSPISQLRNIPGQVAGAVKSYVEPRYDEKTGTFYPFKDINAGAIGEKVGQGLRSVASGVSNAGRGLLDALGFTNIRFNPKMENGIWTPFEKVEPGQKSSQPEGATRTQGGVTQKVIGGKWVPISSSAQPQSLFAQARSALKPVGENVMRFIAPSVQAKERQETTYDEAQGVLNGFVARTPDKYKELIADAALQYGVPTSLLSALLAHESMGFNENVISGRLNSPVGAQGIGQFMPATAKALGINPLDPKQAIPAAAKYLSTQFKNFGGKDWNIALAAYNAGPGNVSKYGGIPPFTETQNYVRNIMAEASSSKIDENYRLPTPTPEQVKLTKEQKIMLSKPKTDIYSLQEQVARQTNPFYNALQTVKEWFIPKVEGSGNEGQTYVSGNVRYLVQNGKSIPIASVPSNQSQAPQSSSGSQSVSSIPKISQETYKKAEPIFQKVAQAFPEPKVSAPSASIKAPSPQPKKQEPKKQENIFTKAVNAVKNFFGKWF